MADDFHGIMSNMGAPRGYQGQRKKRGAGPIIVVVAIIIIAIAAVIAL